MRQHRLLPPTGRLLTVQDFIVSRVRHDEAVIQGPVKVSDVAGVAL